MKYELQIVIAGFITGIAVLSLILIHLRKIEKKGARLSGFWQTEFGYFFMNSIWCAIVIIWGMTSLFYSVGALVQGHWEDKGASAFRSVILVLVILGIYCVYLLIFHPSIRMGKYVDRRVLIRSLKEETFEMLYNSIGMSEHWIIIGEYYIPKTCLIGATSYYARTSGSNGGHHHLKFYTVDGKETLCSMAIISPDDENAIIQTIAKHASIDVFLEWPNYPNSGLSGVNRNMEGIFTEYMERNKNTDLLTDTNMANIIVEEWKNHRRK